ncbi:MAG: pyrroline-5-carboxylate reductase [Theionarchaea archaeon]|nr:pyrroline-5-carboxylate reductase [Theionarchaea archaeon]
MKIGLIGGGKLAEALIRGLLEAGVASTDDITVSDIDPDRREYVGRNLSVRTTESNSEVVESSEVVILALKPNVILSAVRELPGISIDKLFITVAAGIPSSRVESCLPAGSRLVRVMPNINCAVSESCTALCPGANAEEDDLVRAEAIFGAVGQTFRVDETKMDAVTALSGSGPAYAFIFIEALSDGGVLHGLPRVDSTRMAAQTLLGAAKMVLETGIHPAELKDRVCSPGGTTIAAVKSLEKGGFRASIIEAVSRAHGRSKELSI